MQYGDYLLFETKLCDYFSDASNIVTHVVCVCVCVCFLNTIKGYNKDIMEYVWP